MGIKIVWSERALADLDGIARHLAQFSPEASYRIASRLYDHVNILEEHPLIGAVFSTKGKAPLRQIAFGAYRIFYRVFRQPKHVRVMHVRHAARDEPAL